MESLSNKLVHSSRNIPVEQIFISNLVRLACEGASAYGATLYVVDDQDLRPLAIYNLPESYIAGIGRVRVGTQCCGRAVEHKQPWVVSDMLTDPLFADGGAGALASPIRAGFSVPVVVADKAIAALACHYTKPHLPNNVDIQRNQVFAKLIGVALRDYSVESLQKPFFAAKQLALAYQDVANT